LIHEIFLINNFLTRITSDNYKTFWRSGLWPWQHMSRWLLKRNFFKSCTVWRETNDKISFWRNWFFKIT